MLGQPGRRVKPAPAGPGMPTDRAKSRHQGVLLSGSSGSMTRRAETRRSEK